MGTMKKIRVYRLLSSRSQQTATQRNGDQALLFCSVKFPSGSDLSLGTCNLHVAQGWLLDPEASFLFRRCEGATENFLDFFQKKSSKT